MEHIFSMAMDIPSKPLAFLLLSLWMMTMIFAGSMGISDRLAVVRGLNGGRMLAVTRGRHCMAKYLLNIDAFSLKQAMYLLFSIRGGIFVVFCCLLAY